MKDLCVQIIESSIDDHENTRQHSGRATTQGQLSAKEEMILEMYQDLLVPTFLFLYIWDWLLLDTDEN